MGDEATRAASIVGDLFQAWVGGVQHFYDGVRDADAPVGVEQVLRETSDFVERVMPIAERGVGLTLDLLRPWSKAFADRMPDA